MEHIFVYVSIIEGLMIVCMLGWEIFWLRKMYQVLWRMPTSQQLEEMVSMIKSDRDSIKLSLSGLVESFQPLARAFGSLNGLGSGLGSLLGMGGTKIVNKENTVNKE